MTTQPKSSFEHTDADGDKLEILRRYTGDKATMLSINGDCAWLPDDRALEFAGAIMDAAGVTLPERPATPREPVVAMVGGCYYVDGAHARCGKYPEETVAELEPMLAAVRDQVEEMEARLAVAKYRERQSGEDLRAHRDRVAGRITGEPYIQLPSSSRKLVDRIVELEAAK